MFKFNRWSFSLGILWLLCNANNALAFQEANLPHKSEVKPTRVMPIDGVWTISSIDKRIKIDRGRAYAIDSWAHLGLFEIKKGMVVIKDIKKKAVSNYTGYDLPLLGAWSAVIQENRNLKITVGFVSYDLVPERLKSRQAYEDEMVMAGLIEKSGNMDSEDEDYADSEEDYSDESEDYVEDEEGDSEDYSDGEDYVEDDGYEEDDQFQEDDQFMEDDEEYMDEDDEYLEEDGEDWSEEEEEDEAPKKVKAKIMGPLRVGCVGKQNYLSKGACWSCPKGYKRYSPTRKMSHPKACKERGFGFNKKTTKAKKMWSPAVGCPKGQFGHLNKCKKCPKGTKRIGLVGFDSGNCKYID